MRVFLVRKVDHRWGDYGAILMHGFGMWDGHILVLERTGPYVPPVTIVDWKLVLTNEARRSVDDSGLTIRWAEVDKKHITEVGWRSWDQEGEWPAVMPPNGTPENYVLEFPHSDRVANAMGDLWCVVAPAVAIARKPKRRNYDIKDIALSLTGWRGEDVFSAQGMGFTYVTERAKAVLEALAGGVISFEEVAVD